MYRMCLAGFPTTRLEGATSRVTTAPAPTIALDPITIPGNIVAPPPIEAPSCIIVVEKRIGYTLLLGYLSFVNVTFGPIKTSLPTHVPFHS